MASCDPVLPHDALDGLIQGPKGPPGPTGPPGNPATIEIVSDLDYSRLGVAQVQGSPNYKIRVIGEQPGTWTPVVPINNGSLPSQSPGISNNPIAPVTDAEFMLERTYQKVQSAGGRRAGSGIVRFRGAIVANNVYGPGIPPSLPQSVALFNLPPDFAISGVNYYSVPVIAGDISTAMLRLSAGSPAILYITRNFPPTGVNGSSALFVPLSGITVEVHYV